MLIQTVSLLICGKVKLLPSSYPHSNAVGLHDKVRWIILANDDDYLEIPNSPSRKQALLNNVTVFLVSIEVTVEMALLSECSSYELFQIFFVYLLIFEWVVFFLITIKTNNFTKQTNKYYLMHLKEIPFSESWTSTILYTICRGASLDYISRLSVRYGIYL